ncbi:MAG TPA: sigma 54-interacting transcriptional regulator [Gemmatimonadaceae bacterium]|jgi:DNA-binding NtrC family response regulator
MRDAEATLIGESGTIRRLRATIERVAPSRLSVLVEGPTGSGKELVAALLHRLSGRVGALVAFNVCAIAETMFEDALFGHVRGAYTGAGNDTPGFLREAHGGTVFLDEIGGLPTLLQPKLLRALETGVFRPIGSSRDTKSDFRLVAATNEPIGTLVACGRFRSDLAHRMSGVVLTVPPLEDRRDDIPHLVHHFAQGRTIDVAALRTLITRSWPGNVRELRQVVDAAFVFGRGALDRRAVEAALEHRSVPSSPPQRHAFDASDYLSIERTRLIAALDESSWNTTVVARTLGIHRSTLYRRLRRLRIVLPPSMRVHRDEADVHAMLMAPSRSMLEHGADSTTPKRHVDPFTALGARAL